LRGVTVVSTCDAWAVGYALNGGVDQTLIEHWNGASWRVAASADPGGPGRDNQLFGVAAMASGRSWAVGAYYDGTASRTLIERWDGTAWKAVPSPDRGGSARENSLLAVAVSTSGRGWAVGNFSDGTAVQTLIERWNGTAWKLVPSPDPGGAGHFNNLSGVAARSARDAWAVGNYINGAGVNRTLVVHWNGTAWKAVPSPNAGAPANSNALDSVTVLSAADAWAVGSYFNGTTDRTLIEHWNGAAWKIVASPDPGGIASDNSLVGVTATSVDDAWAVGATGTGLQSLILHWNGRSWKVALSPGPGGAGAGGTLNAVSASSSSNAWAVGLNGMGPFHPFALHWAGQAPGCRSWSGGQPPDRGGPSHNNLFTGVAVLTGCSAMAVGYDNDGIAYQTLAEHWNGTAWTIVPTPDPGGTTRESQFLGVAAMSSGRAWAVGHYSDGTALRTLIARWNGTAWKVVPSPNTGGPADDNSLDAVIATSARSAWAVGTHFNGTAGRTLIEHWNGTTWKIVASPNPGGAGAYDDLTSVAATAGDDAWAVGGSSSGTTTRTLIEHWNGTTWKTAHSPNVGIFSSLSGVTAVSASNAWAVGSSSTSTTVRTLIEHWNGNTWKVVTSPNVGGSLVNDILSGVTATSADNAWAVGGYGRGQILSATLIEHWNGRAWKRVPSFRPGTTGSTTLNAVAAGSPADAWAVGYEGYPNQTVALHWG
jgi:hypothetical protein